MLVVSGDLSERMRATSALRARTDVEVEEAGSAREAYRRLGSERFDVLVIDGDLRPEGGFSVLYTIRAEGEQRGEPTPPAIVLVSRAQDRWLAGWAGAQSTLPKPADPFAVATEVGVLAGVRPRAPTA